MRAMLLERAGAPLVMTDRPVPIPGPGQILLRVRACGVCRTDLHICDGELAKPKLPLILGHEIVGEVVSCGAGVTDVATGARMGVPWLAHTCGRCRYCERGLENLCDHALFTGYQVDGGYAEYTLAEHRYCLPLPPGRTDADLAPLLCAGLIGYRALRLAGEAPRLGVYGFGAAAHIIAQIARHQGREVYAFTRPGDTDGQRFALQMGAAWAGDSDQMPPQVLDAALLFAPVGALVPAALKTVAKGGTVVCAGIHMSEIPAFPYEILWGERSVRSVANLTRRDGAEFMALLNEVPIHTHVQPFPLADANIALERLRAGRLQGAAVLKMPA
ncbi:MAG TPA: zinc-dependent alcohol dehydrogenase family protein [Gammaproteobacteria bacterium]|nr:zinc-dependent alcohol dehydrogenase family protein [Gammaproteobacteria bacterium]